MSIADSGLQLGLVTPAQLDDARRATVGRHGAARARAWWLLVDGRAESPLESRLRLLLTDAGCAPEHLQWRVSGASGRTFARLDLAWPSRWLDVEADGAGVHSQPAALYRDRARQNGLLALGWTVLRYTWSDLIDTPSVIELAVWRRLAGRSGEWASRPVDRSAGPVKAMVTSSP